MFLKLANIAFSQYYQGFIQFWTQKKDEGMGKTTNTCNKLSRFVNLRQKRMKKKFDLVITKMVLLIIKENRER